MTAALAAPPIMRDSHYTVEVFHNDGPLMYHGRFIARTIPQPESTDAQRFGIAFDIRLLTPELWSEKVIVLPDDLDRRTKVGKEQWTAAQAQAKLVRGVVIKQEDADQIDGMVAAVRFNPACSVLCDGESQKSVEWEDAKTGLLMKGRLDWFTSDEWIVDVKTTEDPSPIGFGKSIINYGYHRQAALYLDALPHAKGFLHIAVRKSRPYKAVVMEIPRDAVHLGRLQNERALVELARRKRENDWTPRWHGEIVQPTIPKWAYYAEAITAPNDV